MGYEGFKSLEGKLAAKGAKNPGALAASIGRNKYGKQKFQDSAAKGTSMVNTQPKKQIRSLADLRAVAKKKGA